MKYTIVCVACLLNLFAIPVMNAALSQDFLGQFDSNTDIGLVSQPGMATYDAASDAYSVSGSGKNMWFGSDEFHFVWKRLSGDFILTARARFVGAGKDPHRKLGWMVRGKLEPGASYVDVAV